MKSKQFFERVQEHERDWGNDKYPGRPSLIEIMSSPVVVFWQNQENQTIPEYITLHDSISDVEKHFLRLLFTYRGQKIDRTIKEVYQNQKRMLPSGVKITFKAADE